MNVKAALAAAAGALVVLPATASAHGYISSPLSRQAQCAQVILPCGEIRWEPQSVEGPKGLRSCSGGNARFAELDDDAKGWRVTSVGRTVRITWTLTAAHRTSTWEYFVGGRRVALFDDGGRQPPTTVSHTINLGRVSGRQKLLGVWNIFDTPNAFYACVDVRVS